MARFKGNRPFEGMDFQQFAAHQLVKAATAPVYCRFCGQDIKEPSVNSTRYGNGWRSPWEEENHVHEKCYQQTIGGRR